MIAEIKMTFEDGNIEYEGKGHAEKKDACIICSTLENVLICACRRQNIEPIEDRSGYLKISVPNADKSLTETFKAVREAFYSAEYQFPWYIKVN